MYKPRIHSWLGALPSIARVALLTFAATGVPGCYGFDQGHAPDPEGEGTTASLEDTGDSILTTTNASSGAEMLKETPTTGDSNPGDTIGNTGGGSGGGGSSAGDTTGLPDPVSSTSSDSSGESGTGSSGEPGTDSSGEPDSGSSGEPGPKKAPECGNAILDPGEACDDGILDGSYDGCRPDCTSAPFCGDGTISNDEICDDGNTIDDDGCSSGCLAPICGDGVVQDNEQCDGSAPTGATDCIALGFSSGTLGCSAHCTFDTSHCSLPRCGDGVLDEGEACDGDQLDEMDCDQLGFAGGVLACQADCASFDLFGCLSQ